MSFLWMHSGDQDVHMDEILQPVGREGCGSFICVPF